MAWGWGLGIGDREASEPMGRVVLLRIGYLLGPDYKTMKPKQ